jgi:hypothetical protein
MTRPYRRQWRRHAARYEAAAILSGTLTVMLAGGAYTPAGYAIVGVFALATWQLWVMGTRPKHVRTGAPIHTRSHSHRLPRR